MASIAAKKLNGKIVKDKNGLNVYRAWISLGTRKGNGTPDYKTHTIHALTKKDAQREADKLEAAGMQRQTPLTFGEWAKQWLAGQKKKNELKTTFEYERVINKVLLPEFGDIPLAAITPKHIAVFKDNLSTMIYERKGTVISDHTQLKYFSQMKRMLEHAYMLEVIDINPAMRVKSPTFEPKRIAYYSDSEARHLLKTLAGEHLMWRAIITLALTTGARRGEFMALQWADIDQQHGVVRIGKAAYRITGLPQGIKVPKSASSLRAIPVPKAVLVLLKQWRDAQAGTDEDYVCAEKRKAGVFWMDISAPSRWFLRFIVRHKLPPMSLHGLRHTAATTLLAAGLTIPEVALLLGHSSPTTTSRSYAHAASGINERAESAMDELLSHKLSPKSDKRRRKRS